MDTLLSGTAGLWLAVFASGLYHGVNPGMGWPLAVSAPLMERRVGALYGALVALAVGHLLAMLVVLLPFAAMLTLLQWQREIQIGAGAVVIAMGLWIMVTRRHPKFLARVPPTRLALWSFLVAIAHGAALMLVPIYLGLCGIEDLDAGHRAMSSLLSEKAGLLLAVALAHTAAMIVSGGALAYVVYRWLGLQALSKLWFDLDLVWGASLVLVGCIGLLMAL